MFTREKRIAWRSRRNRRNTRTTAGIGSSRLTHLMVRSRLYVITSTLPRNRSVIARVHGATRRGCQSASRNRTIVMAHLLRVGCCWLLARRYLERDSNPHCVRSERTASTSWAIRALWALRDSNPENARLELAAFTRYAKRPVALPTGIEPASPGRRPGSLARCFREQSRMKRFV